MRIRGLGWGVAALAAVWAGLAAGAEPERFVEGTVAQASRFPDPKRSTYADCLYTVRLNPPEGSDGGPVLLALPAFMKRVAAPESRLKAGQKVRVRVRPFEDMPEDYQGIQMADDIAALDLPLFAGLAVETVERFSAPPAGVPPPAAGGTGAVVPAPAAAGATASALTPLPPQPAAVEARARQIAADRARIEALLAKHGGWEAWARELEPIRRELREKLAKSPGGYLRKGSVVLGDTEATMGFALSDDDPYYRFALATLKDMKEQFALAGTDFIAAPTPMREVICAAKFVDRMPEDGVLQPYWLKLHLDLLRQDIETIDLGPVFQAAIDVHPYVYLPELRDGHPGCDGAREVGRAIAARLSRYTFDAPRQTYSVRAGKYHRGDLDFYFPTDGVFPYEQVIGPDGKPAVDDPRSEVLMIGDSMLTAPQGNIPGMALGMHAMRFAGFPFAFIKRAGAAPDMSIHLARVHIPGYFSRRRVCVFIFASEYFVPRNKPWRSARFIPGPPASSASRAGEAGGYPTITRVLDRDHLRRLSVEPETAAKGDGTSLALDPSAAACRVALPGDLLAPGRETRIAMQVQSQGQSVWKLTAGDRPAGDVLVQMGGSRISFTLPPSTGGWSGVTLPAGAPAAVVQSVEAWEADQPGPEDAFAPDSSRFVARYNSARDFEGVGVTPPGRIDDAGILILDPVPAARTVEVPPLKDVEGRPARWLLVAAEADGPVALKAAFGDRPAGELPLSAARCRMVFVLPEPPPVPAPIRLHIPAGAPAMRISTIELRSDAGVRGK